MCVCVCVCTLSLMMQERSSGEGDPTTLRMWFSWSRSDLSQGLHTTASSKQTYTLIQYTRYAEDTMLPREDRSIGEQLC